MDDNEQTEPKRGPGRPPKAKAETVQVMYEPLDPNDPSITECHGFKFKANVAKDLPAEHPFVELARGNPWFSVDGKRHPRVAPTADAVPPPGGDTPVVPERNQVDAEDVL